MTHPSLSCYSMIERVRNIVLAAAECQVVLLLVEPIRTLSARR